MQPTIMTDKPLRFELEADTGLVWIYVQAGYGNDTNNTYSEIENRIVLTPNSSAAMLRNLDAIAKVLRSSQSGPIRPKHLQ
jgi:hypothetical protein